MPNESSEPPVVLVTGAGRGLGVAIALELARAGMSVAVHYGRSREGAEQTVARCLAERVSGDQRFAAIQGDLADPGCARPIIEQCLAQLGRLDGLVNNAGVSSRARGDILDAGEESYDEVLATNLRGPFFLTREAARHWVADRNPSLLPGGAKVVFVSSVSAVLASPNRADYCISKAGLAMASQLWAARLAPEGIQVLEIRPGIMESDMTAGVKGKYDALIAGGLVPQGRWGTGHDVGLAVRLFLAGQLPFTTGSHLYVDGGLTIPRL